MSKYVRRLFLSLQAARAAFGVTWRSLRHFNTPDPIWPAVHVQFLKGPKTP